MKAILILITLFFIMLEFPLALNATHIINDKMAFQMFFIITIIFVCACVLKYIHNLPLDNNSAGDVREN